MLPELYRPSELGRTGPSGPSSHERQELTFGMFFFRFYAPPFLRLSDFRLFLKPFRRFTTSYTGMGTLPLSLLLICLLPYLLPDDITLLNLVFIVFRCPP